LLALQFFWLHLKQEKCRDAFRFQNMILAFFQPSQEKIAQLGNDLFGGVPAIETTTASSTYWSKALKLPT